MRIIPTRAARALLCSAALLCACGHTLPEAVKLTQQELHGVAIAAQAEAGIWSEQVDARIAYCRRQAAATEIDRARCMGVFGRGDAWEEDLGDLREAYDAAADALQKLGAAAARLESRQQGRDPETP